MPESDYPQRIICLTEEPTEILYRLGEEDRIAGISGFTVRPPRARREKPKVSAYTSARIERIVGLKPDLVIGFSDLQADIAAELVRRGLEVHIFNQRSVDEIIRVIRMIGAMVGARERAEVLIGEIRDHMRHVRAEAREFTASPRVYFEEWDDPMISGIQWVAELIRIAGGEDCFPELAAEPMGRNRIIADPGEVVQRNPDIIIGSWCGKKFRPEKVAARPGWGAIAAVRDGQLFEIKSSLILQPGPAALLDGLRELRRIIGAWQEERNA